jgi:hypothetical protein
MPLPAVLAYIAARPVLAAIAVNGALVAAERLSGANIFGGALSGKTQLAHDIERGVITPEVPTLDEEAVRLHLSGDDRELVYLGWRPEHPRHPEWQELQRHVDVVMGTFRRGGGVTLTGDPAKDVPHHKNLVLATPIEEILTRANRAHYSGDPLGKGEAAVRWLKSAVNAGVLGRYGNVTLEPVKP